MPGGTLQLLAYNEHNNYLSGNPQITFFKSVYKKHTNFTIETKKQTFTGTIGLGNIIECKINKYDGDLLSDMYLEVNINLEHDTAVRMKDTSIINYGHNIIDYVEFNIGGETIDRHYGKWLQVWNEINDENDLGYNGISNEYTTKGFSNLLTKNQKMMGIGSQKIIDTSDGNYTNINYRNYGGGNTFYMDSDTYILKGRIFIPFHFWFCRNPGLALPLLSLYYEDIIVKIKLNSNNFGTLLSSSNYDTQSNILGDYITSSTINTLGIIKYNTPSNNITVSKISCGSSHIGIITSESSNNVYMWGGGYYGELGNGLSGSNASRDIPKKIELGELSSGYVATELSLGRYHSGIVVSNDGNGNSTENVFMFGRNHKGQLGNNSTTDSSSPVKVSVGGSSALTSTYVVTKISCGYYHTGIITSTPSDENVFMWGYNNKGQLGNNSTTDSSVAINLTDEGSLTSSYVASEIDLGVHTTGIITTTPSDENVFMWGYNNRGQLGNNSTTDSSVPVKPNIASSALSSNYVATEIAIGNSNYTGIITSTPSTNNIFMWGHNKIGQLGNNSTTLSSVAVQPTTGGVLTSGYVASKIGCGGSITGIVVTNDGTGSSPTDDNNVYMFGVGTNGQLGNGNNSNSSIAVQPTTGGNLSSGYKATDISCGTSVGIITSTDSSDNIYMWGKNDYGQLGNGNFGTNSNTPGKLSKISDGAIGGYQDPSSGITSDYDIGGVSTLSDNSANYIDNSEYTLWIDYIFLDDDERSRFLTSNHEYLIQQIQYEEHTISHSSGTISNKIIDLEFRHPIKELIWTFQRENPLYHTEFLSLANHNGSVQLLMNKDSRFEEQNVLYFTRYQPYRYHIGRGGVNNPDSIYVYSFSIYPEKYQPSGICNFSEIDVQMELNDIKLNNDTNDTSNFKLNIYAINYNILKISGGTMKLLYGK